MGALNSFLDGTVQPVTGDPALNAVIELESAARSLDLEAWVLERLRHPEFESTSNLLLTRDSGEANTLPVMHVRHTGGRAGCSGTISFAPDVFPEQLRADAMRATWQNAIFGIRRGGSATAVRCDPRNLTERELRRLTREFANVNLTGPCVLSPGAGTNAALMGWLSSDKSQENVHFAGIPEALGGFDHNEIASCGVVELIERSLARSGKEFAGSRMAVQGTERLCLPLITQAQKLGAHIVGIADISGALLDRLGMNASAIHEHLQREGVLLGYSSAEPATNEELLECECEVLVLAASEAQITAANCDRIKAGIVIEAVPGAITSDAVQALHGRDVAVIPELLASGGYKIAAQIECGEDSAIGTRLSRRKALVRRLLRAAESNVNGVAVKWGINFAQAALMLAVDRVAAAFRATNI